MLTNERDHVAGAGNASESRVENKFRHPRGGLYLGLQNVRLRRKQHTEPQLFGSDLVGNGVCGLDEHLIGDSPGVGCIIAMPTAGKVYKLFAWEGRNV